MAALGLAGAAGAAAPTYGGTAADTVKTLQDAGYSVQLNGSANGPLARCGVTGVHGVPSSTVDVAAAVNNPAQFTTAYVDVSCP